MSGFNKKNQGGLRVAHDFDDFMEDREVVLTLQDSYILGGQDVNRDGDVLENIDMAEVYKSQVNIENRTAKKDDYLDNKYAFGEKKMLAHYDEKSTEKEGIMLDSLGEFNLERQRKIEAIKNKLAGPKKGGEISLETSKNNVASEYFTSDEMKKFKKPIKKANNVKKNREDILKFLEDTIEDEDGNLGTRDAKKARERADLDDVTTKKLKTENYEAALEKAREQTKYSTMVDEEYDEVQRAIENQRRAAQQKVNKVEDVVRTLIETNKTANSIDNEVIVLDNKKKPADAEFIELDTIKASTDFLRGVATKDLMLEQKAKITEPVSLSLKDTRNGMASVVNVSLPSERLLARNKAQSGLESLKALRKEVPVANSTTEITDKKEDAAADDVFTKEDMEQLNEERNFIEEEDFNEGGLAAALKAARERGYLMENEAEIRGRGKDKTYREELAKFDKPGKKDDGEDRVKLEYRDKNGRLMTPKEAFRYQCRIFHGIDSSKTKQEKERKKWEASKKLLQTAPQESGSMKAFQILQKQNNQAHVVLDTKNLK